MSGDPCNRENDTATHDSRDPRHGGEPPRGDSLYDPRESPGQVFGGGVFQGESVAAPSRYRGLPVVFLVGGDGVPRPCPFLLSVDDVAAFFRLADSKTRFPAKSIERYRKLGLKSVRIGRRRWFTLPDVLDFLDRQQARLRLGG